MKKRLGYILITALVFLIGFRVGHYDITLQWQKYNPQLSVVNKEPPPAYQEVDFQQFWDTWDAMARLYLDKSKLDPQKMVYGAISGMVRSVGDPYTVFLDPEQNKEFEQDINGTYEGVGLQIGYQKERLVVIAPLKDTPAEAAGIRAGDAILSIDGKETFDMALFDAVAKIRGPLGTQVTLTLTRDGYESSFDVTLTRAQITVKTVDLTLREDGLAYLKVSRFGDQTAAEWDEAIKQIVAAQSKGIILDLRNNPGGYLSGAVYLASEFLSAGTVVVEQEGSGEFLTFEVNHAASLPKTPLVVLINKGSASASEIVAGALQVRKRATLVGEQSFGKGTVQRVEELPSESALHVTTAKWLLPDKESIDGVGLKPDTVVEMKEEDFQQNKDPQLEKAVEVLQ